MVNLQLHYDINNPELLSAFDELPFWSAPFGLKLLDQVTLKSGMKALDIGCGTGFPLTELAMRLGPTSHVYGLDPWTAAQNRLIKKLVAYGIQNVTLLNGVSESIPLIDNSIDLIVSNNGLNNVTDLELSLQECCRVSKPGAKLVFTFNLEASMAEFYTALKLVLHDFSVPAEPDAIQKQIASKRLPVSEYKRLLSDTGFTNIQVTYDRFQYRFASGTALFSHYFIRMAFLEGWMSVVPEPYRQQVFNELENRFNRLAASGGEVTLTIPYAVISAEKENS